MSISAIGHQTSVRLVQNQQPHATLPHGFKRPVPDADLDPPSKRPPLRSISHNAAPTSPSQKLASVSARPLPQQRTERIQASAISPSSTFLSHTDPTEQVINCTPAQQNPLLSPSHPKYGLPVQLVANLAALGITKMYHWQSSCLLGRGIMQGRQNLVYTAPTGGGKSLVAELLLVKRIVEDPGRRKKAIMVLPYVALVQEKLKWLRRLLEGVKRASPPKEDAYVFQRRTVGDGSIRVAGFFGGSRARARFADVDIAVCTIEKANNLVNQAIEDGTVGDVGVVVMDELHMVDDSHRGNLMELMASKLLSLDTQVQIIGMSATLKNTETLAKWLRAKFYNTKYVPVPIHEHLVFENAVYEVNADCEFFKHARQLPENGGKLPLVPARIIQPSSVPQLKNNVINAVVALAVECAAAGYGALVFCRGRSLCQRTAMLISRAIPMEHASSNVLDERKDLLGDLRNLPTGLDEGLGQNILQGVAFHHAGLTAEEKDLVAEAYDKGVLRVIIATCSLAAGINLPARRVILQGAKMGQDLVGPAMLRQMRGRAGRKGKDEVGETYLCCQADDIDEILSLLESELPAVASSLSPDKGGIKRALLEAVTVRLATHVSSVRDYVQRTLLFQESSMSDLTRAVDEALAELEESKMILTDGYGGFEPTDLGRATVASSLAPEDGIFLYDELRRALKAFVMDGEMHVFYTFTPVWKTGHVEIKWNVFRNEVDALDESGLRVLQFVGVNPALVNRLANSPKQLPETTPEETRIARVYRRFYTALQLRDLCNEMPISAVAHKYDVPRGFVQTLAQVCEGFAAGMIQFCEKLGWNMLAAALELMRDRLKAGARADLLELAQIPFVKSRTARLLWENGFSCVRAVAEAQVPDLVPVLKLAQPQKARWDENAEQKYQDKVLAKAEIIIGAAGRLWERQQRIEIECDI